MRRGSSSYSRLIPLTFRAQYIGQARGHHQLQWEDVKRDPIQCGTGGHRHEKMPNSTNETMANQVHRSPSDFVNRNFGRHISKTRAGSAFMSKRTTGSFRLVVRHDIVRVKRVHVV